MVKELKLHNWKSFENSVLYIDPLTFVIGTNASGKSNILDALSFLNNSAKGIPINEIAQQVRGGLDWIIRKGASSFSLSVVSEFNNDDLTYTLECRKYDNILQLISEKLEYKNKTLYAVDTTQTGSQETMIPVLFMQSNKSKQKTILLNRQCTILSQIDNILTIKEVKEAALMLQEELRNVFILNPEPNKMRDFSALSETLLANGSNIAGLLASMDGQKQKTVEKELTAYVAPLPERDIKRIWAETVGRLATDAMLYCEEEWVNGEKIEIDARSMSDGTLRFIAIVVALLTGKRGSLLVVEEIDNGLHPSRSQELVKVLKELGKKSQIDIICTTHNPVLIDTLGNKMIPFISYVSRSEETGYSVVSLLEDKQDLAKLMARASVGDMMREDAL